MANATGTKYDVIVVGSGFGGAVSAARLAEAGLRVLILERGPWWETGRSNRPSAGSRPYPRGALGSRKLLRGIRWARSGHRFERVLNRDGFLELHRFARLTAITSSGVGGGSHHYTAIMREPSADFFDAYPPEVTGDEMDPYFAEVQRMMRPMPPPVQPDKDAVFDKAVAAAELPPAEALDLSIAWGDDPRHPQTCTNAAGVEQPTSTYQGTAFVGATDGSTMSLDLTHVPIALRHGAELRPFCEATGVAAAEHGYEVRYTDHRTGGEVTERAPRLVLAAGCLNTLRLLFTARDADRSLPGLPRTLGQHFSVNGDRLSLLWRSRVLADSSYGPSFALPVPAPLAPGCAGRRSCSRWAATHRTRPSSSTGVA